MRRITVKDRLFDPAKLDKLNDPQRLVDIPPEYIWDKLDFKPPPNATFVEIGAGTGFFCRQFLKYTNAGRVYACDISEIMIDWMKDNIANQNPGIIPMLIEDSTIPLEDGTADLIYTINLHHELYEPARTLEEIHRLLKPGGVLFIADWRKQEMPRGPRLEIRYTPQEVISQMTEAGFREPGIHEGMPFQFLVTAQK